MRTEGQAALDRAIAKRLRTKIRRLDEALASDITNLRRAWYEKMRTDTETELAQRMVIADG